MRAGQRPHGPTPDILFTQPTKVNGVSVGWLDCKLYYGSALLASHSNLPVGKLASSAARTSGHYGPGAYVYGQGFCRDLVPAVPHALLLDATPVDMTAVLQFQQAQT